MNRAQIVSVLNKIFKNDLRLAKVFVNAFGSIASKGVNLLITIITVPLLLNYLGQERYGMFAMATSLLGFMTFSDFGLGLGLQNRIPEYLQNEDITLIQKAISATFFSLIGICFILLILLIVSTYFVNWADFFNVHSTIAISEAKGVAWAFFLCFLVGLPFTTVSSVLVGNQEGYINEIWRSGGNVLCILLLILGVSYQYSTPILTAVMYGTITFSTILSFLFVFGKTRPQWRPKLSYWKVGMVRSLFKDGGLYFVLQVFAIGLITIDGFFIAQNLGAESVSIFMVGLRLVTILSLPLAVINGQILPALNDAIAKEDHFWIKNVLKKALLINTAYFITISLLLIIFGNSILNMWVGDVIKFDLGLWIGFIFLFSLIVYNSLISNILMTPKLLSFTIVVFPISVCLLVGIKWFLIHNLGLSAMLIGGSLSMLLIYIIPSLFKFKKINFL